MVEDIHNLKAVLERDTERYLEKLPIEDREGVKQFIDELSAQGYSAGRVVKYLYSLTGIRKKLDKPFDKLEREDIKRYATWLEKSDYSDWTKHDLKIFLRKYIKWLGNDVAVDWLKVKPVKNGKMPEEVLTEEDIKRTAGDAYSVRDKAFILSLYESGCRMSTPV
jgi:site-specific recombinase XerD